MSITLLPEIEVRLEQDAKIRGLAPSELANSLLNDTLTQTLSPDEKKKARLAMYEEWRIRAENVTPEELERGNLELEELKANMNANRALEGRPPVFP